MRRFHVVALAVSLALVATGCPKKKDTPQPGTGTTKVDDPVKKPVAPQGPNALPTDTVWAAGEVDGVALEVVTRLVVPGLKGEKKDGKKDGKKAKEAKQAKQDGDAPATAMSQTMYVTDGRGRIVETTEGGHIPKGTELRYNGVTKKYVLADPAKKLYWAMTGSQLSNVMEGGPELKRSNFTITVTDIKDKKKTIGGFEATKSEAEIAFDWKVKTKDGEKTGKIKVKLGIWHSADAKLKDAWGDTLIALMAIPFQDAASQKIVDELKAKIKFPVKWAMEFIQEGGTQEKGEAFPKLVSKAAKIDVKKLEKTGFAWPPAGYAPATGPYTFGEGGQTASEGDLGKLPAKEGKAPKNVEPVDGKDKKGK